MVVVPSEVLCPMEPRVTFMWQTWHWGASWGHLQGLMGRDEGICPQPPHQVSSQQGGCGIRTAESVLRWTGPATSGRCWRKTKKKKHLQCDVHKLASLVAFQKRQVGLLVTSSVPSYVSGCFI